MGFSQGFEKVAMDKEAGVLGAAGEALKPIGRGLTSVGGKFINMAGKVLGGPIGVGMTALDANSQYGRLKNQMNTAVQR